MSLDRRGRYGSQWKLNSKVSCALARTETRGMHRRLDYTEADPTQRHAFASGGLDEVWVRHLPKVERAEHELAA